jgi:hypothetical protein
VSSASRSLNALRASVRAALRRSFTQAQRTKLKRVQGLALKRLAPVLSLIHGNFTADELGAELARRLPAEFEILMVHSSFDGLLPMYKGSAKELLGALMNICGRERTLVMPSFVMGGRDHDKRTY